MNRPHLGEFQELVLLVILSLETNSYGLMIQEELEKRTGRKLSRGSLHTVLSRLEDRGLLDSKMGGATNERGGRRKRFFTLTNMGKETLQEVNNVRQSLWKSIPSFNWQFSH